MKTQTLILVLQGCFLASGLSMNPPNKFRGLSYQIRGGYTSTSTTQFSTKPDRTLTRVKGGSTPTMGLKREMASEAVGTALLVLFGCGCVCTATYTGAHVGVWQVAATWGLGVALAILAAAPISGGHLNPAMTTAFAAFGGFPWKKVPFYYTAQMFGAAVAAGINYLTFSPAIKLFEASKGITRSTLAASESAVGFGMYFNPEYVSTLGCLGLEIGTTALLSFLIFLMTDSNNDARPQGAAVPLLIGAYVAVAISLTGPLTMTGMNPARDLAPRIVSFFAGWKAVAFQNWWCYTAGPLIGALLGGGFYSKFYGPLVAQKSE